MNNVYHGKCLNSASEAEVKLVYMPEIPASFNDGDLLSVFFTNENTAASPSIVFTNDSTQNDVSTSDDSGILIKTQDVDVESTGLWNNGETVLFCFVQKRSAVENSSEEPLYLEIIGKIHASDSTYGITKLNGIEPGQSVEDWLNRDNTDDDYDSAINVATVKNFIWSLFQSEEQEEEDEEQETPSIYLGLRWVPDEGLGDELRPLGEMSLGNIGNSVSIEIPRFITRYVPDDLFFIPGDEIEPTTTPRSYEPGNGIALINTDLSRIIPGETEGEIVEKPENTIPYHIRFDKDKLVLGHNGGAEFNRVIVRPKLDVEGAASISGALTCSSSITGGAISGTTIIASSTIKEKDQLLSNRYSGKLKIIELTSSAQTIPVKSYKRFKLTWSNQTNWQPIGVIGYNADSMDTNNSGDVLWANIWECFVINTNDSSRPTTNNNVEGKTNDVQVAITNVNASKSIYVRVKVYVLCVYTGL